MGSGRTCALRGIAPCEGEITHEHYISEAVLELVCRTDVETGRATVVVQGLHWTGDESREVSIKTLTAKSLCRKHNQQLSNLDSNAARLFRLIQRAQLELQANDQVSWEESIDGNLFERWILKVLFGIWSSGGFGARRGTRPTEGTQEILLGEAPFRERWGLYGSLPQGERPAREREFSAVARERPDGTIGAASVELATVSFELLLGTPDNPNAWGIYKPRGLILRQGTTDKKIRFEWTGPHSEQAVIMTRIADHI